MVSGSIDAPRYALREVDLNNKPHFEALSYTWRDYEDRGNEKDESVTRICDSDSAILEITTNLANIMRHRHNHLTQPGSSGKI